MPLIASVARVSGMDALKGNRQLEAGCKIEQSDSTATNSVACDGLGHKWLRYKSYDGEASTARIVLWKYPLMLVWAWKICREMGLLKPYMSSSGVAGADG